MKWAREYVIKTRDDVHLLHAAAGKTPEQTSDASETIRRVAELEAFFAESAETSAENRGTTTSVLLDGASDLRDQLVDYVDELDGAVDMLIVGTRGIRGALKRFALGSVSSYCLATPTPRARRPDAVAREAAGPQDETDEPRARPTARRREEPRVERAETAPRRDRTRDVPMKATAKATSRHGFVSGLELRDVAVPPVSRASPSSVPVVPSPRKTPFGSSSTRPSRASIPPRPRPLAPPRRPRGAAPSGAARARPDSRARPRRGPLDDDAPDDRRG